MNVQDLVDWKWDDSGSRTKPFFLYDAAFLRTH